jgi:predicted SAM-dependent methyltransferase
VIEHFYLWEVQDLLKEWLRVLKPGSPLILELPSMDKVLAYIAEKVSSGIPLAHFMTWLAFWGDPKHKSVGMCHRWGYTYEMLKNELSKAGFVDIKGYKPRYHFPERDMRVVAYKPLTT